MTIALLLTCLPTGQSKGAVSLTEGALWPSSYTGPTTSFAVGDLDSDGHLDLVVGTSGGENAVFMNRGGSLQATPILLGPISDTWAVALGDLDSDGDLDLVVANGSAANAVHLNEGGTLASTPSYTLDPTNDSRAVVLADLSGDGNLDAVFGNSGQASAVHCSDGSRLGSSPCAELGLGASTSSLAVGDVDDDGDLDVVLGNRGEPDRLYLFQDGVPDPTPGWSSSEVDTTRSLRLADLDGDGRLDLVSAHRSGARLHRGAGQLFESSSSWSVSGFEGLAVDVGDLDDDGRLDLALATTVQDRIHLGPFPFGAQPDWLTTRSGQTPAIVLGDLDGDGDLDLATGHPSSPDAGHRNEAPLLEPSSWSPAASFSVSGAGLGDLDLDGDLDLVFSSSVPGEPVVVYQGENGQFPSTSSLTLDTQSTTRDLRLVDVDGDDHLDLVLANEGEENTIYLGDGTAFSTSPSWTTTLRQASQAVAAGDVDGDGIVDLVFGNTSEVNTLYRGLDGSFETSPDWQSTAIRQTSSVALGDLDSDGDLDLVCGTSLGAPNSIYLNDGAGLRTEPLDWAIGVQRTQDIALGDIDGDGRLDLICGNDGRPNSLFLNVSRGAAPIFTEQPDWQSSRSWPTRSVALADIDGDGDLDLICGNLYQPNTLYLNEEGLLRTDPVLLGTANPTLNSAAGDVDSDGDMDLLLGNLDAPNQVLVGRRSPPLLTDPTNPSSQMPNNAAYLRGLRVTYPDDGRLEVAFVAVDVESDPIWIVQALPWAPNSSEIFGPHSTSPAGETHSIVFDVSAVDLQQPHLFVGLTVIETPRRVSTIQREPVHTFRVPPPPPVVITIPEPADPEVGFVEGRDIAVRTVLTRNQSFVDGTLFYRRGGERDYQQKIIEVREQDYVADIPSSFVTAAGVQYWVEIDVTENGSSETVTVPRLEPRASPLPIEVTIQEFVEPEPYPARRYRLISFPAFFEFKTLKSAMLFLGPPDPLVWRGFRYDPGVDSGASPYVELTTEGSTVGFELVPGRAFWFVSQTQSSAGVRDDLTGRSVVNSTAYEVELAPGWNMVGHPFTFPVAWDSMLVEGQPTSLSKAILDYPKTRDAYADEYRDAYTFHSLRGYWVWNDQPDAVTLEVPPFSSEGAAPDIGEETYAWRVRIGARSSGVYDRDNFIGVSARADDDWDRLDRLEPAPAPGRALSLYFPRAGWGTRADRFSADVRNEATSLPRRFTSRAPDAETGYVWPFDVCKNFADQSAGDPIILDFAGTDAIPTDWVVLLVDHELGRVVDLRREDHYQWVLGRRPPVRSEDDARFSVLVTDGSTLEAGDLPPAPVRTALLPNVPNPFNPVTRIRFDLARAGFVELRVFSLEGGLVRVLEESVLPVGTHEVLWNGEDHRGRAVASGVYLCRLTAPGFEASLKMVLLR